MPSRVRRERSGGMRRTAGTACGMSWKAPTHTSQHCYGVETEPKPRHSGTGSPCCHRSEQPGDVCGTDQEALRHGCSHTTPPIPHCRRGAARSIPQGHGTAPAPSHSAWLQPVNLPSGWPGLRACSQVPRHTELPHQRAQPVPARQRLSAQLPPQRRLRLQPGAWGLQARAFGGSKWLGKRQQGTGTRHQPGHPKEALEKSALVMEQPSSTPAPKLSFTLISL